MRLPLTAAALTAVASLTACSGGSNPIAPPRPSPIVVPVLTAGFVATYSGSDTIAHTYSNPTGSQANYTAGYSFATTRSTENSAPGAIAPFDLHAVTTYAIVQDPGQGIVRRSATTDTFEAQSPAGAGTLVTVAGSTSTAVGTDETAGAAGGGPYTQTATTGTTYDAPQIVGVFPLVSGATTNEPIGSKISRSIDDANASGTPATAAFATSSTETVNSDGSYALSETLSNGQSQRITESSNGSGTIAGSGPVFTLNDTIGVSTSGGSAYTIPITTFKQNATAGATPAPIATPQTYAAADWYPGGGLPTVPFQTDSVIVKGPVASLPAGCAGAIAEPNLVEVDTTVTTLNVDASYATNAQRNFASTAVDPVCVLRTVTTQNYSLTTGAPSETTAETYAQILTGTATNGPTSASAARHAP